MSDDREPEDDLSGTGWRPPAEGGEGEATRSAPDALPDPGRGWGRRVEVIGEARGIQSRQPTSWFTGRQTQVVDFRVDRFERGNLVARTLVEMRGRIRGALHEGDRVGLRGRPRHGIIRARKVTIYDRDWRRVGEVRASAPVTAWQIAVSLVMLGAFVAAASFVVPRILDGIDLATPSPRRLRAAVRDLPAAQLLRRDPTRHPRVGAHRRRVGAAHLLQADAAARAAGDRLAGDLSVPVDVERPDRGPDLGRNVQPITVAIFSQLRQFGSNIELIAPASFVSLAIPLAAFLAFQRYFVQGLLAGSVK